MKPIDPNLIQRFRKKDKLAFAQIYDAFSHTLYGIVLRIVRSETLAQDVLQEAFVKIWNHSDQYDGDKGSLFTWLLNITRNTAIDKIRSAGYRREKARAPLPEEETGLAPMSIPAFEPDHIGLRALVENGLDEKYRLVIDLMYFKGMTQREVQEYLGIPLGTVKSRTRIALRELRRLFQNQPVTLLLWIISWIAI